MAKRLHEEDIKLNISVNGNEAQKEIFDLEKRNRSLSASNRELKKEMDKIPETLRDTSQEYQRMKTQMSANTAEMRKNSVEITKLTNNLKLTELTTVQLREKAKQLKYTLDRTLNSNDRFRIKQELDEVNARLDEMNFKAKTSASAFNSASTQISTYRTHLLGIAATITGLTYSFERWIDYSGQLADAEADVMKTTGLTAEQIKELNTYINGLDTRTSRTELLKLAEEAGRLGKSGMEDIQGFMTVADKLKVALGDDLGGEEAIRDVGKLTTTYKVGAQVGKEFEGAMEALGSAINEVSASGSNQAGFLVDYLNRMAGVAAQAKLSASDNLGYAATFNEIGLSAEVSSTAMNKIMLDMFLNPGEYAKIAGMEIQAFNNLLNTDSNAAMLKFLEGLNGNTAGLQQMVIKMEELDAGGTLGVNALSALASNLDVLKARQATANQAIQEGISLQNEFNVKNNNLAATLDKIKKTVANWFTSETLVTWLTAVVTLFAKFIGAVEDTDKEVAQWRSTLLTVAKVIATVGAGLVSYNAWLKLTALWTNRNTAGSILYTAQLKLQNAMAAIAIARSQLYAAAQLLIAGNVRGAIAAIRLLNATLFASPWGIVLGLITAVAAAYVMFKKNVEEANAVQKMFNDVHAETQKSIAKERAELSLLLKVAQDETRSKEERLNAIKKLNEISPKYLGQLNLENINTAKGISLIKQYTDELYKNARAKAVQAQFEKLSEERVTLENTSTNRRQKGGIGGAIDKGFDFLLGETKSYSSRSEIASDVRKQTKGGAYSEKEIQSIIESVYVRSGLKERDQKIAEIDSKLKALEPELLAKAATEATKPEVDITTPTNFTVPTGTDSKTSKNKGEDLAKKAADERKKYLDDLLKEREKANEEILRLQRELQDAQIDLMEDGFDKERAQLSINHRRKIEDLKAQLIEESTFTTLDNDKAKYTKLRSNSKDKTAIAEYDRIIANIDQIKQTYRIQNEEINNLITQEEANFYTNLLNIQRQEDAKQLNQLLQSIEDKRSALKRSQLEELQQVTNMENGKLALQGFLSEKEIARLKTFDQVKKALARKHQQEQLALEEQLLQEQINALNNIITGSNLETMDFSILTEEQQTEMLKKLEDLKNKLIELGIEKEKLKGSDGGGETKSLLAGTQTDILGMSVDQWQQLYDNISNGKLGIEEMIVMVNALNNAFGQYYAFVAQQEKKQLERFQQNTEKRKTELQHQLDQGYISQETYNEEVAKLEDAYNQRRAEIEYKQAKRQKQMDLISSLTGTAAAVVGALGNKPWTPANFALAGIVGAMGAFQTALIARQPLPTPGFEDGYINVQRSQDGKNFRAKKGGRSRSGLVNTPTHFLAGEQGQFFPEMIISGTDWKAFSPALKAAVQNQLHGINSPGYEGGTLPEYASMDYTQIVALLSANYELLSDLKTNGVQAYLINDHRFHQKFEESNKKYNQFIAKTKV